MEEINKEELDKLSARERLQKLKEIEQQRKQEIEEIGRKGKQNRHNEEHIPFNLIYAFKNSYICRNVSHQRNDKNH